MLNVDSTWPSAIPHELDSRWNWQVMDLYVRPPDAEGNVEIDQTLGEKMSLAMLGERRNQGWLWMFYICEMLFIF